MIVVFLLLSFSSNKSLFQAVQIPHKINLFKTLEFVGFAGSLVGS